MIIQKFRWGAKHPWIMNNSILPFPPEWYKYAEVSPQTSRTSHPVSLDAHSVHSKVGFWRAGPWALPSSINSQYSCAGSFTLSCSQVTVGAFINKVTETTSVKSEIRLQSEETLICYEVCDWLPVFCAGILCLQQRIAYKLRIYSSSSFIEIKWSHHWSAD